ncbi:bZIP transcription factor 17-like [Aristolochia californica]|uniref:bZIP transcription factor 17-like n=1 Tax=Aristolochia californica TaxID=171875 RepID=UPI0035D7A1FF
MAESSLGCLDSNLAVSFPPVDTDLIENYFPVDFTFGDDFANDLGFDDALDFSIDDFLAPPDNEECKNESGFSNLSHASGSPERAGFSNSTSSDSHGADDRGSDPARYLDFSSPESEDHGGGCKGEVADSKSPNDARVLDLPSPDSNNFDRNSYASDDRSSNVGKVSDPQSPDSAHSAHEITKSSTSSSLDSSNNPSNPVFQQIKPEDDSKLSKRRKEREDGNGNPKVAKCRRSSSPDMNATSTHTFRSGSEEEEKRMSRLMRNRESAQLSRQRKKNYVEELEDKVRTLHSTVIELNGKLSYIMAENATLRQQVGGGALATVYAPPPPMGAVHFPWVPCTSYAVKPQGAHVPLIPIPRLKPQQPVPAPKAKKCEKKMAENKTKKVASVSFVGFLFFFLLFGGLFPFLNGQYGGVTDLGRSDIVHRMSMGQSRGRVLPVSGYLNHTDPNYRYRLGAYSGKKGPGERNFEHLGGKNAGTNVFEPEVKCKGECRSSGNSSKPLLASLYVPRNDRLVKIVGNLIIHSVLASEKASSHAMSGSKNEKGHDSLDNEAAKTRLAIPGSTVSALALSKHGIGVERQSNLYRASAQHPKAIGSGSGSGDFHRDKRESAPSDGSLQKWFREGLAGPILKSGMCTEVFQFKVSNTPAAIPPVESVANFSESQPNPAGRSMRKNRRILHHPPLPLPGTSLNETVKPSNNSTEDNFHGDSSESSSMVVSLLVDPREAVEDGEGMFAPKSKSLPRIFVVVLLDSVKYVTYSCVLPLKGATGPHLMST